MQHDLRDLLAAARLGELTPEGFNDRLAEIHVEHVGEAAHVSQYVDVRRTALAQYTKMADTIERHHQLERLARTLGIEPEPSEPLSSRP